MKLRAYKESDAEEILSWINNEREFRLWSADRYKDYPISAEDITNNYKESNKTSNFYPLTLEDEGRIIGHLILRNPNENIKIVRLGFIIVNRNIRGKGYGKKLIEEAIGYAKERLEAKIITLGVFTNNEAALRCYETVGFEIVNVEKNAYQFHDEMWDCAEMEIK